MYLLLHSSFSLVVVAVSGVLVTIDVLCVGLRCLLWLFGVVCAREAGVRWSFFFAQCVVYCIRLACSLASVSLLYLLSLTLICPRRSCPPPFLL